MKTKFAFLCGLAMVWCASLTAQTEFSKTGTRWYKPYEHDNIFAHKGYHTRMDLYRLGEDTLLAGESWKKLYYNEKLLGAFREVGKEVWYMPLSDGTGRGVPRVLYDFSMQVGDNFYCAEYEVPGIFRNEEEAKALGLDSYDLLEMTVTQAETVEGRRVLYVAQTNSLASEERWIEGIGSERGFFERWRLYATDGSIINTRLLSVVADGKTLYFNGELVKNELPLMLSEGMSWHQEDYEGKEHVQYTLAAQASSGRFSLYRNGEFVGFLQEANRKIYWMETLGEEAWGENAYPRVLACCYDFSLEKGDVVARVSTVDDRVTNYEPKKIEYDTTYVTGVDTADYNGIARRRLYLGKDSNEVWVEGIGSLRGFMACESPIYSSRSWTLDARHRLICCYEDGDGLYLHPDYLDCTTLKGESVPSAKGTRTLLDVRVADGMAAFYWTGSSRTDRLYVYAADGGKVADIRMDGETVEVRGLQSGIYYYRLELKDTEEAVVGKLLVR
ncbi:hypothetical protein [Paraprevotella xylaniphila]|uniref:hypothetical protein n=1 Tax=Paraprevotella xylaniphila TaxID=454155 RepID=UPI00266C90B7|nr:hypothetical protein [Paraprevotella xylaniphila]